MGAAMALIVKNCLAAAFAAVMVGAALPQPASADSAGAAEQEAMEGRVQATAIVPKPGTETLRGVVEGHDTLRVRLSQHRIEEFKVRNGLIFNAVRFGDVIEVTVEETDEKRTIVSLRKE
jgi:hypothetical protein